jgi:hypothetical protein
MSTFRLHRPSPALVVATIALFVALGGTGYAAFGLPRNSVGTKQLKNGAVTTSKIRDGAVTGAKVKGHSLTGASIDLNTLGTVPSAVRAGHASAADSATNATSAANAANATNLGGAPAASFERYAATLPSGVTETGEWGYRNSALAAPLPNPPNPPPPNPAGSDGGPFVSFPIPLAAGIAPEQAVHAVYVTAGPVAHCAGLGHADPGYLCVYQLNTLNVHSIDSGNIFNPENGKGGIAAGGFSIYMQASGAGDWLAAGQYAVTAP